jgi:hypothetical protein
VKNFNLIFDSHLLFLLVVKIKGSFPLRKWINIKLHMSLLLILLFKRMMLGITLMMKLMIPTLWIHLALF